MMSEQKTITFYDESHWDSPFMETWSCDIDSIDYCACREDCYIAAMQYFGYPIVEMTQGDCYNWTEDELESIAREWGIVLDFVS